VRGAGELDGRAVRIIIIKRIEEQKKKSCGSAICSRARQSRYKFYNNLKNRRTKRFLFANIYCL